MKREERGSGKGQEEPEKPQHVGLDPRERVWKGAKRGTGGARGAREIPTCRTMKEGGEGKGKERNRRNQRNPNKRTSRGQRDLLLDSRKHAGLPLLVWPP
jgi:hypothetical protein